jgi:orotidine-5'-phosphate decarboxylase
MGPYGIEVLIETCSYIPEHIPVILDAKRGDIGNTAEKYAEFAYEIVRADAVTVNPYMGFDSIEPLMRTGKCPFVLCLTSNSSAEDFQMIDSGGKHLFETVASKIAEWSSKGEIGIVAGATQTGNLGMIRSIAGDLPVLVPGVGAQGGDAKTVIGECGGKPGLTVINSSRGIIYASSREDFAEKAREKTLALRDELNSYRRSR